MLTCLALAAAFSTASMAEIPALSTEIAAEAHALSIETQLTPALLMRIDDFSSDAARLSSMLRSAGAGQDMPCILQGIAKDARDRVAEFLAADTQTERDTAFTNLRVLADDAAMIAPIAATVAEDGVRQDSLALR
jgi:hypothetical protein